MFKQAITWFKDVSGLTARAERAAEEKNYKETAAITERHGEYVSVLNQTLAEIDEEAAKNWEDKKRLDLLLSDLSDNCDDFRSNDFDATPARAARIKNALEKILIGNASHEYAVNEDDVMTISAYVPAVKSLVFDYVNEFEKANGSMFEEFAETLSEEESAVSHLSKDGTTLIGRVMGSRGSVPLAELNSDGTAIDYYIGCFEGNKQEFLEQIDRIYPEAYDPKQTENTNDSDVGYSDFREVEERQAVPYDEKKQKHRADYLGFIDESETILFQKASIAGPTYLAQPDPAI